MIRQFWRKNNCLKALDDWENWEYYHASKTQIQGSGMRMTEEGSVGILRRAFLRAYTQSAFGLTKTMGYEELAVWLTINGYPTSIDDCKSAKRAKLVGQCVPVTLRVVRMIRVLLQEFPGLALEALFKTEDLPQIRDLLNKTTNSEPAQITLDAPNDEVITD